jgi:hypothetical protein
MVMMSYEEYVERIQDFDKEIERLKALRTRVLAECAEAYPDRPATVEKPAEEPTEAVDPSTVRLDQLGTKEIADQVGMPWIEVRQLHHIVMPDGYTYRRVLIPAAAIPDRDLFVVLRYDPEPEAHLLRVRGGTQVAVCGRQGDRPGFYWVGVRSEDMEDEVELCQVCASFIPGTRIPL